MTPPVRGRGVGLVGAPAHAAVGRDAKATALEVDHAGELGDQAVVAEPAVLLARGREGDRGDERGADAGRARGGAQAPLEVEGGIAHTLAVEAVALVVVRVARGAGVGVRLAIARHDREGQGAADLQLDSGHR